MGLLVTVAAFNGLPPQRPASVHVSGEPIVIGRHPDCLLELPDPECSVSGRHATITPSGNGYTITDTSTNGTFLNAAPDPIPADQPVILNDGDRLLVGPYLLQIAFEPDVEAACADPFAMPPPSVSEASPLPGIPEPSSGTDILGLLDPGASAPISPGSADDGSGLTELVGPSPGPEQFFDRPAAPTGSVGPRPSIEHAHLGVPTTTPAADASPTPTVPDDYDLLNDQLIRSDPDPRQPSEPSNKTAAEPAHVPLMPDSTPEMEFSEASAGDRGGTGIAAADATDETALFAQADVGTGVPQNADAPPRSPAARGACVPRNQPESAELVAFLDGLGRCDADAIHDPEAFLQSSGQLVRAAVEGMIAVMMARAEFKSELRLEVTTIRARENNPFQFCVDADDALDRLLLRRSRGFLDPTAAVHKTFDDIQAHQMATIAGMRAALKTLLSRFEPARLEQRFEGESHLDKLWSIARKSKCWDLFVSTFEQVADDASDDFMRLFNDAFNAAYEDQVRRLAAAKRGEPD